MVGRGLQGHPGEGQVPRGLHGPLENRLPCRDAIDELGVMPIGAATLKEQPAVADNPIVDSLGCSLPAVEEVLQLQATSPEPIAAKVVLSSTGLPCVRMDPARALARALSRGFLGPSWAGSLPWAGGPSPGKPRVASKAFGQKGRQRGDLLVWGNCTSLNLRVRASRKGAPSEPGGR